MTMRSQLKTARFLVPLSVLALSVFLVAVPRAEGSASASSSRLPLAVRVRNILGVPRGTAPYLPALAKLVRAISPHIGSPHAEMPAVFGRHGREARQLVLALNNGADPTALRDAIIRALNLEGRYVPPLGSTWLYGSLIDRMYIAGCLRIRALHFFSNHHPRQAARYARAALLLSAQEDIQIGTMSVLAIWAPSASTPFKFSAAALAYRRRLRSCLAIGTSRENRLDRLYIAARARPGKYGFTLQKFFDITIPAAKLNAPIAPRLTQMSRGASKPATKGRNSGVQNQPLIFYLITSNNLSCQYPY